MRKLLLVVAAASSLTGCVGTTATPAVQGKAYVVSGSIFGTTTYNCDSDGGNQPKCWQVIEKEAAQ